MVKRPQFCILRTSKTQKRIPTNVNNLRWLREARSLSYSHRNTCLHLFLCRVTFGARVQYVLTLKSKRNRLILHLNISISNQPVHFHLYPNIYRLSFFLFRVTKTLNIVKRYYSNHFIEILILIRTKSMKENIINLLIIAKLHRVYNRHTVRDRVNIGSDLSPVFFEIIKTLQ